MIYSLMYNDTEELSFTQKNKFVFGLSILIENFIFVYIQSLHSILSSLIASTPRHGNIAVH